MKDTPRADGAATALARPKRDVAIPTLPARDMDEALAFYERMGFRLVRRYHEHGDYAVLVRGDLELHFFGHAEIVPLESYGGCYLRVEDVDGLHVELVARGVPLHRAPEDKPWGMREFAVVDPSGNLLRIGRPLDPRR